MRLASGKAPSTWPAKPPNTAGISPQVISRPSQIAEMMPLPHAPATVIKLHGNYAVLDQVNTVDELETYEPEQQELPKRVLDEYGLIICGWSADWDTALVSALEGVRPRRYPMFWSSFSTLGEAAKRLTAQHNAAVIRGMTAEEPLHRPPAARRSPGPDGGPAPHPRHGRHPPQVGPARSRTQDRGLRPRPADRHRHPRPNSRRCPPP